MAEIGLPANLIVEGDHTLEGGMGALTKLIGLNTRPTAILCSNDMTAIGVIREAFDHNIKIPADLPVIGFDDIRLAQFTTPPLTTVQMSQTELAKLAFRALMNEVSQVSPNHRMSEYRLITNLILRRSTALARSGSERKKLSKMM
jgi:LacI family transcriptional regulator